MRASRALARSIVADGAFGAGAQFVVRRGRRTEIDESFGFAAPGLAMTPSVVQGVYCLTKPIVASAVCVTADTLGIALDDDVRATSPRLARLLGEHAVSLRDVLSHRAGLHPRSAVETMFLPKHDRWAVAERATFAEEWRMGVDRAYSDFQGWNVLRCWIEDVTGLAFGPALDRVSLSDLGLRDCYFGVTDQQWLAVRERLGVPFIIDEGVPLPMLHGLLRKFLDDPTMQAVGGHATADTLASFYEAVLDVVAGRGRAGLPEETRMREMLQPTGPRAADELCNTPVAFGLGFMVDLVEGFGPAIGANAFGHLGLMGNAFAFADPDNDLVAVFVSNAMLLSPEERRGVGHMRRELVAAIYEDLRIAA